MEKIAGYLNHKDAEDRGDQVEHRFYDFGELPDRIDLAVNAYRANKAKLATLRRAVWWGARPREPARQ